MNQLNAASFVKIHGSMVLKYLIHRMGANRNLAPLMLKHILLHCMKTNIVGRSTKLLQGENDLQLRRNSSSICQNWNVSNSKKLSKKRNKNAPGLNGIPFLVYKKCPKVLDVLLEILNRVWKDKKIPSSWQKAIIVLLAKSDDLKSPAEFRPIALLNAEGLSLIHISEPTRPY